MKLSVAKAVAHSLGLMESWNRFQAIGDLRKLDRLHGSRSQMV